MNEIQAILSEATIEEKVVKLNCGDLDRATYEKVDTVLSRLWGKWNRKRGGHVFNYDPEAAIAAYVDSGILPAKNELSFFPTPESVIEDIWKTHYNSLGYNIKTMLEPSAGHGAIACHFQEKIPECQIDIVEWSALNVEVLKKKGFKPWHGDFLDFTTEKRYDLIVMNPPFNVPQLKNCWIEHLYHAWDLLTPTGNLYAVVPTTWDRQDRKHKQFRSWLSQRLDSCWEYESGTFKESGTMVPTRVIKLCMPVDVESENNRELHNNRFEYYYNGDYGYEYYRWNPENSKLSVEQYVEKAINDSLTDKLLWEAISDRYKNDYIAAMKILDQDRP